MLHSCFVVAREGTGTRIDMDVNRSGRLQKMFCQVCAAIFVFTKTLKKASTCGRGRWGCASCRIKQVAIKHRKLVPPRSVGGGKFEREAI